MLAGHPIESRLSCLCIKPWSDRGEVRNSDFAEDSIIRPKRSIKCHQEPQLRRRKEGINSLVRRWRYQTAPQIHEHRKRHQHDSNNCRDIGQ